MRSATTTCPISTCFARFFTPYADFRGVEEKVEKELNLPGACDRAAQDHGSCAAAPQLVEGLDHLALRSYDDADARSTRFPKVPWRSSLPTIRFARSRARPEPRLPATARRRWLQLAKRPVAAVLSGHVHDAFDIIEQTANGPVRMIGAGTLSQRIRSTPPSFNEITWDGARLEVHVRSLSEFSTPDIRSLSEFSTPDPPVHACPCPGREIEPTSPRMPCRRATSIRRVSRSRLRIRCRWSIRRCVDKKKGGPPRGACCLQGTLLSRGRNRSA